MEKDRLEQELFKLEGLRTKEIIGKYLSEQPMIIADIGGAAGFYAFWLQEMGHDVSLIDLSPGNIELAKEYSKKQELLSQNAKPATRQTSIFLMNNLTWFFYWVLYTI